jgi:hypothetical protein
VLPPVVRWTECSWELEPFECRSCGKVYFWSMDDLLSHVFDSLPERPKRHDCGEEGELPFLLHPSVEREGLIRWDPMARRDEVVTWKCLPCDEVFEDSLRAILRGEAHQYCWRWWARYRVHPTVPRTSTWQGRQRREGCGYRAGRQAPGERERRRSRGCD